MRGQCGAQQEVGGGGGWGTETRHTGPTQSEDRDRGEGCEGGGGVAGPRRFDWMWMSDQRRGGQ